MELARVEIREEAGKAGKAAGMLGGGAGRLPRARPCWRRGGLGPGRGRWTPVGRSSSSALVIAAIAAVLAMSGRDRLRDVRPVPDQTVDTLKEDARWARAQVK